MIKNQKRKIKRHIRLLLMGGFICLSFTITSCSESNHIDIDSPVSVYDSSQPVVFKDFTPKEGPMRTKLYINGSNFGTDASKIKVKIGEKEMKVVGSDGQQIYCVVPQKTTTGQVSVSITGLDTTKVVSHTFNDYFTYVTALFRKDDDKSQLIKK